MHEGQQLLHTLISHGTCIPSTGRLLVALPGLCKALLHLYSFSSEAC